MSKSIRTLYWDTSVFLCFLDKSEDMRRKICEDILHHARDGQVSIVTGRSRPHEAGCESLRYLTEQAGGIK
jgi:hypothetical protein